MKFELFLINLLFPSCMTLIWNCSNLPCHLFNILRHITYHTKQELWKCDDGVFCHRCDWEQWIKSSTFNRLDAELLTCPICYNVHLSFWISFLVFLEHMNTNLMIAMWLLSYVTSILIFKKVDRD